MAATVSIIIPCYNGARYIPALAESLVPILRDGQMQCDVIFIDDGSKDQSVDLARKHLPNARIIQQQNRGPSAARNAGVAVAQGEFLQLLDVDDTIEPNKLELQAAAASAQNADVVYSDWRLLTLEEGKLVRTEVFAPAQAPSEMVEALLAGWYLPPVGYLFRRTAYLELGGCDEKIKVWEDFDLFLRFAIAGKVHAYVPGILSNYYRCLDVKSLSRRDPRANAISREAVVLKALDALTSAKGLTAPRRKAAARALFGVLRTGGIREVTWLRGIVAKIRELDPGFKPFGSLAYRAVATVAGLVNAERVGIYLRR